MRVAPEYQRDPSALSLLYVKAPRAAALVPLLDASLERDDVTRASARCRSTTPGSCRR